MCSHFWPLLASYEVIQSWKEQPTLNRMRVRVCNNCPAVKITYQFQNRKEEKIIECPVDNVG